MATNFMVKMGKIDQLTFICRLDILKWIQWDYLATLCANMVRISSVTWSLKRSSVYIPSFLKINPLTQTISVSTGPLHSTPLTGRAIKPQRQGHIGGPIAQP